MPNYSGIWTEQAVMQANGAGNWPNAPGAPTIGTATVLGATSVSVTFTAPTFAGIPATITGYTVTSSPGGLTGTGASSPITVAGLTTGTPYTFTVQATNASGTGPASAASNSVTPVQIDYIEDVFSTYLYTGNDSTQTITNGIDLSGKGGLVWMKSRTDIASHALYDTVRGATKELESQSTNAQTTRSTGLTAFNSNGFSIGSRATINSISQGYASWTFRKQPKFFDVVTYTGNGTSGRTVAHSLGSVPGCIIVKRTSGDPIDWLVYHRGVDATSPQNYDLKLNTTAARVLQSGSWNNTAPTSTVFTLGDSGTGNTNGETYVAYIFAHDAGGFGLSGTDNVISCGSLVSGTVQDINLGYEPQWIMYKNASGSTGGWTMFDTMRGMTTDGSGAYLQANTSAAEATASAQPSPLATGFRWNYTGNSGQTFIYIAIRRGPMKVPTSGTSVYNAVSRTGTGTAATITGIGFAPDLLDNQRTTAGSYTGFFDRLRGTGRLLYRALTDAETAVANQSTQFNTTMDGFAVDSSTASDSGNNNTVPYIWHCFKRAPSFFDEVCYTGNSTSGRSINHNLTVVPQLMIVKNRTNPADWAVFSYFNDQYLLLNLTNAASGLGLTANSTTFNVGSGTTNNASGDNYVSYLFATCAGVSKVGSYTGTGALQTVNCGFAAGARFILIKRTDSTGDWYVYDSTRGITSGNDPYLLWNTTGAEVTGTDYINTASVGFQVTAAAPAGLNASGGTYIFLAIA